MIRIDGGRLLADLRRLATFGATPDGGVSRPSFSPADLDARAWLAERAAEAGLGYREDAAGNVFLRLEATDPVDDRVVWTGSHLDSVPNGGALDGALGVVSALEAVRALAESGLPLRRSVEAVSFADEEGAYGGFLGSKAAVIGLDHETLRPVRGRDGDLLVETMAAAGYPPERIAEARVESAHVVTFLEVHIEQGAVLEEVGARIGVVTDIVGVLRGEVELVGRPDHAGTTHLSWAGATGPVHVLRDGVRITTTAVSGSTYTDAVPGRGGATFTYRVCLADDLRVCSPEVVVTF